MSELAISKRGFVFKIMIKKECLICEKTFYTEQWKINKGGAKYCSRKCFGLSYRGKKHTKETKQKMSNNHANVKGCNNPSWKGDKATKVAIHLWVIKRKGKASDYKCKCGKQAHDWSNKDHNYKRKLSDYSAMCVSCHRIYDLKNNLKQGNKIGNNQFKKN